MNRIQVEIARVQDALDRIEDLRGRRHGLSSIGRMRDIADVEAATADDHRESRHVCKMILDYLSELQAATVEIQADLPTIREAVRSQYERLAD